MTDRTTKALLLAIAVGLWMNVAGQWLRPAVLQAQNAEVASIELYVSMIANGTCRNQKICR